MYLRLEGELGQYKAKEEEEHRGVMMKRIENMILKWVYRVMNDTCIFMMLTVTS